MHQRCLMGARGGWIIMHSANLNWIKHLMCYYLNFNLYMLWIVFSPYSVKFAKGNCY